MLAGWHRPSTPLSVWLHAMRSTQQVLEHDRCSRQAVTALAQQSLYLIYFIAFVFLSGFLDGLYLTLVRWQNCIYLGCLIAQGPGAEREFHSSDTELTN